MKERKHLFKKVSEDIVLVNERDSMEQMFGKLPDLPKGKKWDEIQRKEIVYKCICGKQMKMVDLPDSDYPDFGKEFYAPILKGDKCI